MKKERLVKKQTNKHFSYENIRNSSKKKSMNGITLIALVITILFSYDERIKYSNSKGFLLQAI